jgi:hypothetical protein
VNFTALQTPQVRLGAEAEREIARANKAKDTSQLEKQLKELRLQLEKQRNQEQQQRKVSEGKLSAIQLCQSISCHRCGQPL